MLRQRQFISCSDPVFAARMSADFLCGKLLNEKNMLLRAAREAKDADIASKLRLKADEIAAIAGNLRSLRIGLPARTGGERRQRLFFLF